MLVLTARERLDLRRTCSRIGLLHRIAIKQTHMPKFTVNLTVQENKQDVTIAAVEIKAANKQSAVKQAKAAVKYQAVYNCSKS